MMMVMMVMVMMVIVMMVMVLIVMVLMNTYSVVNCSRAGKIHHLRATK